MSAIVSWLGDSDVYPSRTQLGSGRAWESDKLCVPSFDIEPQLNLWFFSYVCNLLFMIHNFKK